MQLSSGGPNIYSGFLKDTQYYSGHSLSMPGWDLTSLIVHVNHDFSVVVFLASYASKNGLSSFGVQIYDCIVVY